MNAPHSRRFALLFILCLLAIVTGCSTKPSRDTPVWLKPSGYNSRFHPPQDGRFASYVDETRLMLRKAKYFPPATPAVVREFYLDVTAPFEMPPASDCPQHDSGPSRGILLVHGLLDTPYIMADLARLFSAQCFMVRTVMLPGHGTRPGDLLQIKRKEWTRAVRFGINTLKHDVDEVYVGGFSLGGALSLQAAAKDESIAAVLVFAPALEPTHKLAYLSLLSQRFVPYFKTFDEKDSVKYESLPSRAGVETYLLGLEVERLLEQRWRTPLYVAVSFEDETIDARRTFDQMFRTIPRRLLQFELFASSEPRKRRWVSRYYRQRCERAKGCHVHDSYRIQQGILSLAHVGLIVDPANRHYGRGGVYRNCLYARTHHLLCEKETITQASCSSDRLCYGESIEDSRSPTIRRLTFNPLFTELAASVKAFIERVKRR